MIFKIEEFAVFDGPGIRTTVFFKGCPLRCKWCHNPESHEFKKQLMISRSMCTSCGNCSRACPGTDGCKVCGECIKVCTMQCRQIAGMVLTAEEIAAIIMKSKDIYDMSGGGVTFSGGEPLAQSGFLMRLIDCLQDIHKAMETSGFADGIIFSEIVNKLDLIIMDIKIADSALHKKYTGVDNRMILSNLEYLKRSGKPFWIRIPLIPGITDTVENMERIADILKDTENLQRLELMPYNRAAGAKYPTIGKTYLPGFNENAAVNVYLEPFLKYGINGVVI